MRSSEGCYARAEVPERFDERQARHSQRCGQDDCLAASTHDKQLIERLSPGDVILLIRGTVVFSISSARPI